MSWLVDKIVSFFRRAASVSPNSSEKLSCPDFADILAWSVLRSIKENRDGPPYPELHRFAQSVKADADAETIDNEILLLLSFLLSRACVFVIDDRPYLDELIPRFYNVLASHRWSEPSIFEALAIARYEEYLEPYNLDIEEIVRSRKNRTLFKFTISQFGKNLRSNYDFETDDSDYTAASIALAATFTSELEFIRETLDKLEFGKSA